MLRPHVLYPSFHTVWTQSGRSVVAHAMHDLPLRKMSESAILTHKHWESGKAGSEETAAEAAGPEQNAGRMMQ